MYRKGREEGTNLKEARHFPVLHDNFGLVLVNLVFDECHRSFLLQRRVLQDLDLFLQSLDGLALTCQLLLQIFALEGQLLIQLQIERPN